MKRDMREQGRIILAHGEVTGHCHEIVHAETGLPPSVAHAQYFEIDGQQELIVLAECELTHQDHSLERRTFLHPDGSVREQWVQESRMREVAFPAPVRQGDVFLRPTSPGTWVPVRQREYSPEAIRNVAD